MKKPAKKKITKKPMVKVVKEAIRQVVAKKAEKPVVKQDTPPTSTLRPGDIFEIRSFDDIANHFMARAQRSGHDAAMVWREAADFMKRVRYYVPTMLPDGTHFDPSTVPRPAPQPIVAKEIQPKAPEPPKPAFVIPPKPTPAPSPRSRVPSDDPKKLAKRERARLRRLKRQKGGK